MAKDPVCGMEVNEETAKLKACYEGKTYYFCSEECAKAFKENPLKYTSSDDPCRRCGICC
ncbi:MAG: YHS domain-containing protein [Candidatus Methanomethylicota archaeon]|uniref:YHS domain-containing protein n=1 Tax=Thermoproteota archaeon TaxID=2056631 RepID=A0A497EWW3_9CREN|nr:MAG: YHS domain-containing protein [Candidatus Verstraetearchaeota archaeon]RLE53929.1 MAG: YHS domain-containing protein [Candidatus Verstraetearchaeota archaeon]